MSKRLVYFTEDESTRKKKPSEEPNLEALRYYLESGKNNHLVTLTPSEKRVIWRQAKNFQLGNNQLLFTGRNLGKVRYVESNDEREQLLEKYHRYVYFLVNWRNEQIDPTYVRTDFTVTVCRESGHFRRDLMLQNLKRDVYWYSVREDVEKCVRDT